MSRARTPQRRKAAQKSEGARDAMRTASPRDTLLARARRYAKVPAIEDADPGVECLGFVRAGERYLIETRHVVEVATRELTRMPGAPPALLGVVNLRGEIVPVFDLGRILGRSAAPPRLEQASLIVLGALRAEAAIYAEALEGTCRLKAGELSDSRPAPGLLRGTTRDARVVLDGAALLEGSALAADAGGPAKTGSEVTS
jgi:purine-binding chemotaxis protein CheW